MASLSPYSALNSTEQEAVSLLLADLDTVLVAGNRGELERKIADTPKHLRTAFMSQALPSLIEGHRTRRGVTPTLHELRLAHPDLAEEISDSYSWIPASDQLPSQIRGYRILSVIGEGGQATVLRAQDDVHSAVAIKLSNSAVHNEYVLRERKLLGECDHAGIVRVISSGKYDGRAYFVMPYLRGATLADRFAVRKPTTEEVKKIMMGLCSALEHLHQQGILHRDIKPANVWLDESGNVKLIDLGMALQRTSWSLPQPQLAEFNGTPAFMSPEQAASDGKKDSELSDVFSLGATLYWLLTGKPPFAAANAKESMALAADGTYDKKILLASKYPKALKQLCLKAMAMEPGERFASANDFLKQLSTISQHTSQSGKRTKILAAAALLCAVIASFGTPIADIYSDWNFAQQPDLKTEKPPEKRIVHKVIAEQQEPIRSEPVADEKDTVAEVIQASDFQVSVTCSHRDFLPWGSKKPSSDIIGKLTITPKEQLFETDDVLEFRLGRQAWRQLDFMDSLGTYTAMLSQKEVAAQGPLEVRFASQQGSETEDARRLVRFDIDAENLVARDKASFIQELVRESSNSDCFDLNDAGWDVIDEFSIRYSQVINDFLFSTVQDGEFVSLTKRLKSLIGENANKDIRNLNYNLRQAFALVSKDIQSSPHLWVKVEYINGISVGPVLFSKSHVDNQEDLAQAKLWLEQLKSNDGVAEFRHSEFRLKGLLKIAPVLTHLHMIGEYGLSQPHPDDQKDARSQDSQSYDSSYQSKPSTEMTVDLVNYPASRSIKLPPLWRKVKFRAQLSDGSHTPTFVTTNSKPACGWGLVPVEAQPSSSSLETYVYIQHDQPPSKQQSVLRFLQKQSEFAKLTRDRCLKSRLLLMSMIPVGAIGVEHYSDRAFTKRVSTALPGMLYARFVDSNGKMVGFCSYRLSESFVREMAEHALAHISTPDWKQNTVKPLVYYEPED